MVFTICGLMATQAHATIIFMDNFDTENGGVGTVNYVGFANWTVSNGTVDIIGNGFADALPGNGLYVDLDGSTSNAGILSTQITVTPGEYWLSFDLAGSQSTFGSANNSVDVSFGMVFSESFTAADFDPFSTVQRSFTVLAGNTATLAFDHDAGGDNFGILLDNVRLEQHDPVSAVPEPMSMLLFGAGLVGAALKRKFNV